MRATRAAEFFEIFPARWLIEEELAITRQQLGKLLAEQLGHGRPNPRPRIQRVDPDHVDRPVGRLLEQGGDGRLAVGKKRQAAGRT